MLLTQLTNAVATVAILATLFLFALAATTRIGLMAGAGASWRRLVAPVSADVGMIVAVLAVLKPEPGFIAPALGLAVAARFLGQDGFSGLPVLLERVLSLVACSTVGAVSVHCLLTRLV